MTIEAPDYYRVIKELPTPESEIEILTFHAAVELLRKGNYVAEIGLNRDAGNPYYLKKVYKFDGEFFQVNMHLGTLIKTSAFDLYTNKDIDRKFIEVAVVKNEESNMPIKGSSSIDDVIKEYHGTLGKSVPIDPNEVTFTEKQKDMITALLENQRKILEGNKNVEDETATFEISTPPMFFELDTGDLISKDFILKSKKTMADGTMYERAKLSILGWHYEYHLDEKEEARFREFAKLHGVFGKDM